jgi:hypothetical protein
VGPPAEASGERSRPTPSHPCDTVVVAGLRPIGVNPIQPTSGAPGSIPAPFLPSFGVPGGGPFNLAAALEAFITDAISIDATSADGISLQGDQAALFLNSVAATLAGPGSAASLALNADGTVDLGGAGITVQTPGTESASR